MEYLKIQNKGLLNIEFFHLMGVSTKTNDPSKIGEHGTGLKYSIAYLLRNNIKVRMCISTKEVLADVRKVDIKGLEEPVEVIYIAGKRTSLSLQYGKQWKTWEAIREVFCNALDEGEVVMEKVSEEVAINYKGKKNTTTFLIEVTPQVQEVLDKWDNYFIVKEIPLYEDDKVAIYPALEDEVLRIYKQSVLVFESTHQKSKFRFDFKTAPLNELRQYKGYDFSDIPNAIFNSNKVVVEMFLNSYNNNSRGKYYENTLEWSYHFINLNKTDLWKDYIYLISITSKRAADQYAVPETLFTRFRELGFTTESVEVSEGYYGGGRGYYKEKSTIRVLENAELLERLQVINTRYNLPIIKIGAQIKGEDWDFTEYTNSDKDRVFVFHGSLQSKPDFYLEAIIQIASNVYKGQSVYSQLKNIIVSRVEEAYDYVMTSHE